MLNNFVSLVFGVGGMLVVSYIGSCQNHLLYGVFPVCPEISKKTDRFHFLFYFGIQVLVALEYTCTCLVNCYSFFMIFGLNQIGENQL